MLIKQFSLIAALLDVHYNLSSSHPPRPPPPPPFATSTVALATMTMPAATLAEAMDKSHGLNVQS